MKSTNNIYKSRLVIFISILILSTQLFLVGCVDDEIAPADGEAPGEVVKAEHDEAITAKWENDGHRAFESNTWTEDEHDYGVSLEWVEDNHLYGLSQKWQEDKHDYELSQKWREEDHDYNSSLK